MTALVTFAVCAPIGMLLAHFLAKRGERRNL